MRRASLVGVWRASMVWLVVTAVFAVVWIVAYVYASQNEFDRHTNYTVAKNRRAERQRAYLNLYANILKNKGRALDSSAALSLAPVLAEMPANLDVEMQVLQAAAKALLTETAAADAARKEWEEASRVLNSVRWAGYAYAGFSGVYWSVLLAVLALTGRLARANVVPTAPPTRERHQALPASAPYQEGDPVAKEPEEAGQPSVLNRNVYIALFLSPLMLLPMLLAGKWEWLVEGVFAPSSALTQGLDLGVFVWLAWDAYWSLLTLWALREVGAKAWVRVVLTLLLWIPPAQWVTFGLVVYWLGKARSVAA